MKRIPAFVLLALSFAWTVPARAQIFMGPNASRQAQKAAKKEQKTASKDAKKKQKALKKYEKAQRKAAKRAQHHA
jgi:hypothetical protein